MKTWTPSFHPAVRLILVCIFLFGLLAVNHVQPARAATITVINTNDSGAGSLRQAISDAVPGDTVAFEPALTGSTISILSPISINKDLTIDGSGLTTPLTISGGDTVRVIEIGSGKTVTISHLVMADGYHADYAGGVLNYGTLTLSHCTVTGNEAVGQVGGGIANVSVLTITNSMITDNATGGIGGGISNEPGALMTISNSTISGNDSGSWGGGIHNNQADVTIIDSTFYNNTAIGSTLDGGGIRNLDGSLTVTGSTFYGNVSYEGGAIATQGGDVTISNSTLYSNNATNDGGGIYNLNGSLTVSNSTIAGNTAVHGGGIWNASALFLKNNILIDNGVADCFNSASGTIAINVNNLIEDGSCSPDYTFDPMLGILTDNGGPTMTMALPAESPAIDVGDDVFCEATDQRGVSRPQGDHCDVGAYEYEVPQALPVNSLNDPGNGTCDSGECTLREAIAIISSGETVTFEVSLAGGTINLGSEIEIAKDLLIDGSALSSHIQISGVSAVRIFNINSGASVELDHLDIIQGGGVASGGGINNEGDLNISNSKLAGNSVSSFGGAIYNSGTLIITDSTVSNNTSGYFGGGILNGASLTVSGTSFTSNDADFGGGISSLGASATNLILNSTFYNNNADTSGGGIYTSGGIITVNNGTFSDNTINFYGGGIYSNNGTLHLKNSILANSSGGNDCYSSYVLATNINNLIEDGSCSSASIGDPLLGSLADNGGPTETMALLTGSPAIDTGNDGTCESTDQRGIPRPIGEACDIGAYEYEYPYALFLPLIIR